MRGSGRTLTIKHLDFNETSIQTQSKNVTDLGFIRIIELFYKNFKL